MTAIDHDPGPPEPPDLGPPRGRTTNASSATNGHRPLPQAREVEEALLGACLLHSDEATPEAIAHGVTTTTFHNPAHQIIWDAITALHTDGQPVDVITVGHHIDQHGTLERIGGLNRLAALQGAPAAIGSTGRYADDLLGLEERRRTITALTGAVEAAHAGQPVDLAGLLEHTSPAGRAVEWEDVGAVIAGDYEPLVPAYLERTDGQALVYPGLLHWLMGEPGKGKTWVALHAAAEAMASGVRVAYLDWEGNRRLVGTRLRSLGVTPDQADALLYYQRPAAIDTATGQQLGAWAEEHGCGLAILDGFAKALSARNLDEDRAPDVLAFLRDAVDPLTDAGAAVIVLDHVPKDKDGRGLWPRGSGAKQGEVSGAAWMLRTRVAFNRDTPGQAELVQAKDREGEVGVDGAVVAVVNVRPDRAQDRLAITLEPPTPQASYDGPTECMDAILELVCSAPGVDFSARQLATGLRSRGHGFKNETIREAAERLHIAGRIQWHRGPRNADVYSALPGTKPPAAADTEGDEGTQDALL